MSQEPIVVKDDKPSVIYRYTQDTPATVVDGVPARDLTEFDLASMSASQRLRIQMIAAEDNGAYVLEGEIPEGLSFKPDPAPDTPPETPLGADINAMTRAELNTHAESLGVETPELFATKADLIAAIESATAEKG